MDLRGVCTYQYTYQYISLKPLICGSVDSGCANGDRDDDRGKGGWESGVPSAGLYPDESGSKAKRKGALNAT
eukprot:2403045-Pyramimonas_sp.AAC.2